MEEKLGFFKSLIFGASVLVHKFFNAVLSFEKKRVPNSVNGFGVVLFLGSGELQKDCVKEVIGVGGDADSAYFLFFFYP